jgi:hypothetical protein
MNSSRGLLRIACTISAPLLVALGALVPPVAAKADELSPLLKVLALGDSYTSGVGGGDYAPGPCMRSNWSWVSQWAEIARGRGQRVEVDNRACSGATMPDFAVAQNSSTRPQKDYVIDKSYDVVMHDMSSCPRTSRRPDGQRGAAPAVGRVT